MQSGFDPPPPPGGNPPPAPSQPQSFAEQPTQAQPVYQQPQQQPPYPYPYPQAQNPYPQNPYPQPPYNPNAYGPQFIQPAPGYVQNYGGYGYASPTDGKATASLVLGIISVICFIPFTGIAAIIFGFLARRDINRSGGALGGGGLAIGGIVIGSLSTLLTVIYAVSMIAVAISAKHMASGIPTGYPTSPFVIPPPTALPTATATSGAIASTIMHGTIKVVSLGAGRPLQDQLSELRTSETAAGRTMIVQTTAAWCAACTEIDSTIDDPLLQRALANVTLVMVDTDEFGAELGALKMETDAIPYFFKIDSAARATDAISGDEWDENTPVNEAPVLGAFAKGTLKKRRHPNPVGTSL